MTAKQFSLSVSRSYLLDNDLKDKTSHLKISVPERRRQCQICSVRTVYYCFDCKHHMCEACFADFHKTHKKTQFDSQQICKAKKECKKRTRIGCDI